MEKSSEGNLNPFADDIQYFIKAGWTRSEAFGTKAMTAGNGNPAVRIAGFQPALSSNRVSCIVGMKDGGSILKEFDQQWMKFTNPGA